MGGNIRLWHEVFVSGTVSMPALTIGSRVRLSRRCVQRLCVRARIERSMADLLTLRQRQTGVVTRLDGDMCYLAWSDGSSGWWDEVDLMPC